MKSTADAGLLESLLGTLVPTVPCALYDYAISSEGEGFVYLGPDVEAILEVSCADLCADGSRFWNLIDLDGVSGFREAHRRAGLEKKPHVFETRVRLPSGKIKWLRMSSQPHGKRLAKGSGMRSGVLCDVTAQKALESQALELERLRQETRKTEAALASLQNLFDEKSALLANLSLSAKTSGMGAVIGAVAHEVGQPLTAIHLASFRALELWQNRRDEAINEPERLVTLLNNIDRYQSRVVDVIAGVRQLFRKADKDFERVNLSEVVERVLEIAEPAVIHGKISLKAEVEPGVRVMGDMAQLQLVVLNLVNNACCALLGASTKRRLSVRLTRETGLAIFDVSDNGPGLSPNKEERIFALPGSGEGDQEVTGLWLCREILSKHGGCVYPRNRPGGGAKFTLELPAV